MTQIVVENRGFVTKGLSIPYAGLKTFPSIDVGIGAVNITNSGYKHFHFILDVSYVAAYIIRSDG